MLPGNVRDFFRTKASMPSGKKYITTELEDGDLVAVEGNVKSKKKDGSDFSCRFFDFYRLDGGKIKEMRSYLVDIK